MQADIACRNHQFKARRCRPFFYSEARTATQYFRVFMRRCGFRLVPVTLPGRQRATAHTIQHGIPGCGDVSIRSRQRTPTQPCVRGRHSEVRRPLPIIYRSSRLSRSRPRWVWLAGCPGRGRSFLSCRTSLRAGAVSERVRGVCLLAGADGRAAGGATTAGWTGGATRWADRATAWAGGIAGLTSRRMVLCSRVGSWLRSVSRSRTWLRVGTGGGATGFFTSP